MRESAIRFACGADALCGICALPDTVHGTGVVIVVGGPQTRVGSHRQFVLLARRLADAGYPVLRFDLRGMGDSDGQSIDFEHATPDIGAAIDALLAQCPALSRIVLWGLCDAAAASLLYLHDTQDPRIAGVVLANPWVRSEATLAQTHVRHYYGQRLLQPAFWFKLLRGGVDLIGGVREFAGKLTRARQAEKPDSALDFRARMAVVAEGTTARQLVILSGNDFTAREFEAAAAQDARWQRALRKPDCSTVAIADADHTFSTALWRAAVEDHTLQWLRQLDAMPTPASRS